MNLLKKQSLRKIILAICGKKGLALTADRRHEIQLDVTGVASLNDMSVPQLEDLISHLRRLQKAMQTPASSPAVSPPENEWKFVFKMPLEHQSYGKKIFRLAQKIGSMQTVPVPVMSKAYIEGISHRMRGCEQPLEFCDCAQLHKIVQALEVHVKRIGG